jgi:sugar phosphate isomerase/epimerase
MPGIIIAAKCAPQEAILSAIKKAGLEAVELYLSRHILADPEAVIRVAKKFSFRYALHAPKDECNPSGLKKLAQAIGAQVIVFHDIYWEDEWKRIVGIFKGTGITLCIENTSDVDQPLKFMRRYGLGRCLDLEHLQMQCAGVYEKEFMTVMGQAAHVHLTGYTAGSNRWHSHIHHSVRHGFYMLDLLAASGYKGLVVSEARVSLQTLAEFRKLEKFYRSWEQKRRQA